jgi:uncharacterized membrane protein YfcA
MPIVNLIVAQAAAAWVAAPNLVSLLLTSGPAYNYAVAAAAAVIVLIGAFIGARLSKAIPRPTAISAFTTVAFAIIAAHLADLFLAPRALANEFAFHGFTFSPVAAAIAGYFLTSDRAAV